MTQRLIFTLALVLTATAAIAQTPAPPAGTIEYYHVDALGSVRAVTDASGAVVRTHHYHPFGEGVGVENGTDPLRFTGKPRDGETGLDYFGARYYAQRTGRFTTVDPLMGTETALIDPQRWNRYSYVGNRPTRLVDPDGRGWLSAAFKVAKAVVKGGSIVAEFSAAVEDARIVFDSDAGAGSRAWAGLSLATEIASPLSIGDATGIVSSAAKYIGAAPANLTQRTLDHIVDRHWASAGYRNVSVFSDWVGGRELQGLINVASSKGTFRSEGGRTIAEYVFDRPIGTTQSGLVTRRLRVVIDSTTNNVITAYPY